MAIVAILMPFPICITFIPYLLRIVLVMRGYRR